MPEAAPLRISYRDIGPDNGIAVIEPEGFLDGRTAPDFRQALETYVGRGRFRVAVGLERLQYISSAGLGVFMAMLDEFRGKGGDLVLMRAPEKIFKVFDLLGFTDVLQFLKDDDAVIRHFAGK